MAEHSRIKAALSALAEAEDLAAKAAAKRASALAELVAAAIEPPVTQTVKGAPDLITMKEACAIARLSRVSVNYKTQGMPWRIEHPGRTMFERGPFLRWLDSHRAGPPTQQRSA